jgi:hypothetical protein
MGHGRQNRSVALLEAGTGALPDPCSVDDNDERIYLWNRLNAGHTKSFSCLLFCEILVLQFCDVTYAI